MTSLLESFDFGFFLCVAGFVFGFSLHCTFPFAEGRRNLVQLKRAITVDYFENCEQIKVHPYSAYLKFSRNGTGIIISGEEVVTRDFKNAVSVQFAIEKCKDKSNPDTCEYYTTWKFDDFCALRVMPFFPAFLEAHTPPLTCPFRKGRYVVKNARIEPTLVAQFLGHGVSSQVLWKQHILLRENNQVIGCVNLGFRIVEVRIKI